MHSQRLLLLASLGYRSDAGSVTPTPVRTPSRWLLVLVAVGVGLDLLISVALGYAVNQTRINTSQTHILKVAAHETCLASNDQKAADLRRWDEVLTLLDTEPANPALEKFVAGVRKANGTADAPHDCSTVAP